MTALMDVTTEQVSTLGELVDMAQSLERTIASLQAARDGVLALGSRWALEVAQQADHADYGDMTLRTVAAELGAALRVSDRTMQRRMAEAEWRVSYFPLVWAAQGSGAISASHARAITDAGEHLDEQVDRDAYSARMVEIAESESPNRVASMARRIAEQYQHRSLDERHEDARERRRVWVTDRPDGMAELGIFGPAALVHGAFDRLTQMSASLKRSQPATSEHTSQDSSEDERGTESEQATESAATQTPCDARTTDHLRTDLLLDLLLTGAPAGHDTADGMLRAVTAQVTVTVPVLTLLGRASAPPAELDGVIPIDLQTARKLAGAASGWDRVLTDPISGALLASDRYRPPKSLKRQLRARDQRCRFMACGRPARRSDIDHTHDASLGGATREDDLGHFCRRHHVLKHHSPWQVEQRDDGLFAWTSPTGEVYVDTPPAQNTVTFSEDAMPAPF